MTQENQKKPHRPLQIGDVVDLYWPDGRKMEEVYGIVRRIGPGLTITFRLQPRQKYRKEELR